MFARIWSRTKEAFARWFRREPAPGRFESGSKFSFHGWVATAPFVWPSRDYLVYVPKGRSAWTRAPLLVLCHGCRQTPEEFAQGTRIAELADRTGCVVLLPRQKDTANPWRCWNWFEQRTMHGKGEAAIVAAQIRRVRRLYRIDRKRVLVAGMSAGGALAAIMGVRYPRLVSAVAVHSGLACGAATSAMTAISVMQRGPDQDVAQIGADARAQANRATSACRCSRSTAIAIPIVTPRNAEALVAQYLRLNGYPESRRRRIVDAARRRYRTARDAAGRPHRDRSANGDATGTSSSATSRSAGSATRGAAATRRSSTTTRARRTPPRWSASSSPMQYPDDPAQEAPWPYPG